MYKDYIRLSRVFIEIAAHVRFPRQALARTSDKGWVIAVLLSLTRLGPQPKMTALWRIPNRSSGKPSRTTASWKNSAAAGWECGVQG